MGDQAHTPGRWLAAAKPSSIVGWPVVVAPAGTVICDVALGPRPADCSDERWAEHYGQVEANARLIAAAPELLEAVVLAEDIIDDFLGHLSPDEQIAASEDPKASNALKALRAAIAKATGGSV